MMDDDDWEYCTYEIREEKGGDMLDMMNDGMSFRMLIEKRVFPPLRIFNSFLMRGIDDYNDYNMHIAWTGFELDEPEYQCLVKDICKRNNIKVKFTKDDADRHPSYKEWFEDLARNFFAEDDYV